MSSLPIGIAANVQSAYYPSGWDRERLIGASQEDLLSIPPDEFQHLREGMMEAMGAEGFQNFVNTLPRAPVQSSQSTNPDVSPRSVPNFVRVIDRQYRHSDWGFVVYRTTAYNDENKWAEFRRRWDTLIDWQLEEYIDDPGVREAKQRLSFHWVEDRALEGISVAAVSSAYTEATFPNGVAQTMCLNVTAESLDSVLSAPWPPTSMYGKAKAPFITAVSREAGAETETTSEEEENEERSRFSGHFNVAIETLITEFFATIGDQSLDPFELGGHLKGKDIWFNAFKAYRE